VIRFGALPLPASSPEPAPRAKALPRRLHVEADRDLEELTSEAALQYKLQQKARLHALLAEFISLRGSMSGRELAELWLGSPSKEGTIRCWKKLRDTERYPRKADLARLEHLIRLEYEKRGGGAFR
jgi:hypothetical protein